MIKIFLKCLFLSFLCMAFKSSANPYLENKRAVASKNYLKKIFVRLTTLYSSKIQKKEEISILIQKENFIQNFFKEDFATKDLASKLDLLDEDDSKRLLEESIKNALKKIIEKESFVKEKDFTLNQECNISIVEDLLYSFIGIDDSIECIVKYVTTRVVVESIASIIDLADENCFIEDDKNSPQINRLINFHNKKSSEFNNKHPKWRSWFLVFCGINRDVSKQATHHILTTSFKSLPLIKKAQRILQKVFFEEKKLENSTANKIFTEINNQSIIKFSSAYIDEEKYKCTDIYYNDLAKQALNFVTKLTNLCFAKNMEKILQELYINSKASKKNLESLDDEEKETLNIAWKYYYEKFYCNYSGR